VSLGADVVICGRRPSVLERGGQGIVAGGGGRVRIAVCNIADSASVEQMVEGILARETTHWTGQQRAGNFISRTEDLSMRAFDSIAKYSCFEEHSM